MKYKATINIDRTLWDEYKLYCAEAIGVSVSERIRDLIAKDLNNKVSISLETDLPSEFDAMSDLEIAQLKIDFFKRLEERLSKIESRLEAVDGLGTDNKTGDETDGLGTDKLETEDKTDGLGTDKLGTDIKTDKTDGLETDVKTDIKTDKTNGLETYTDKEVAQAEGKTRETIRRYRKDERKPKDSTFWRRWKPTENKEAWLKENA